MGVPPDGSEAVERARDDLARFFTIENRPVFDAYLSTVGLDEGQVLSLLAARCAPRPLNPAGWMQFAAAILQTAALREAALEGAALGAVGLRAPLAPFLAWGSRQIAGWETVHRHAWDRLRGELLNGLAAELSAIAYKTFALEANIYIRSRGSSATLDDFQAEVLSESSYLRRLYLRYAALTRLLSTQALLWRDRLTELLARLDIDAPLLKKLPLTGELRLKRLLSTLSDPHDGGRRVTILIFESGQRVVYKPRSVTVDRAYYALLQSLNDAGLQPRLRCLGVIDRGDYGWIECVEHSPLPQRNAAGAFFRRQGCHLAILYLLGGADFHSENLIASGDQPMLVDLETLLHGESAAAVELPISAARRRLQTSVFASGLLPGWHDGDADAPSPDLSGLGSAGGQEHKDRSDILEDRDGVPVVVRRRVPAHITDNLPLFEGTHLGAAPHLEDLTVGFKDAWRLLIRQRETLARPGGPLRLFARSTTRHVAMATAVYVSLLRRSSHPDFMTRTAHRELVYAILATRARSDRNAKRIVPSELAALTIGDVPKFTSKPASRSIFDESFQEIEDYLATAPLDALHERLKSLDEDTLAAEAQIITLSIATLPGAAPARERGRSEVPPQTPLGMEDVVAETRAIAETLAKSAFVDGNGADWIGLSEVDYGASRLCSLGPELYDGAAGIGVFLALMASQQGSDALGDIARKCGHLGFQALEKGWGPAGGAFSGRYSIVYGLLHIAGLLEIDSWREPLIGHLLDLTSATASDRLFDVVAGSAGAIAVLAAVHAVSGEPRTLAAIVRRAEHLLEHSVPRSVGLGWPPRRSSAPLTGFSHGAAGIGWALIHAGHLTGREDFISGGRAAFEYERSAYSEAHGAWPDFRDLASGAHGRYPMAWCHGGPGIGLSRMTLPRSCSEPEDLEDAARCIRQLEGAGLASSDCLCHGELGNLELLTTWASISHAPEFAERARRRASASILRARAHGRWRCGIESEQATPGLMTGLAGIGYGLMRAYQPERVANLLCVEPPILGTTSSTDGSSRASAWSNGSPADVRADKGREAAAVEASHTRSIGPVSTPIKAI